METCGFMNLNLNLSNSDLTKTEQENLAKLLPSGGLDFGITTTFEQIPSYDYNIESKKPLGSKFEINEVINQAKHTRLHQLKSKIEAILFLSDKPRAAESIAEEAEADSNLVKDCLIQLVQEYEERDGGIIIDTTDGYCMQINDEFETLTENILPIELRTAVLRTLSTIALKEPILQSDLVQIRGGGVYEHVKELVDMGLVKKTKEGHSNIIHTTKFFQENFKLSQNGIELQKVLRTAGYDVEFVRPNTLVPGEEEAEKLSEIQEIIEEKTQALDVIPALP